MVTISYWYILSLGFVDCKLFYNFAIFKWINKLKTE